MAIQKSTPDEKIIGNKVYKVSEYALISEKNYVTQGEKVIIVKDIDFCKLKLDSLTTDDVFIKSFTNTLIISDIGFIDEQYDTISLNKGASTHLKFIMGIWYII